MCKSPVILCNLSRGDWPIGPGNYKFPAEFGGYDSG